MINSNDLFFIDTNILVYSTFEDLPFYTKSIEILNNPLGLYFISNQIINEYINTVTNNNIFKNPISGKQLVENIELFYKILQIAETINYDVDDLKIYLEKYKIKGKRIFDLSIYLTMKNNTISQIITMNDKHFNKFDDINVINPFK